MKTLDDLLRIQRYSSKDVAQVLGVSYATVYNWRKGKSIPPAKYLRGLAVLCGVEIEELLKALEI